MLTEELIGRTLEDVQAMSYEDVIEEMGRDVVSSRTRCATLALTLIKNAAQDYASKARLEQT
jgi:nitrogen fixation NifU-like protein